MAEESVRASSSSSSLFTLKRPNGLENKTKSSSGVPYPGSLGSSPCPGSPPALVLTDRALPQAALHPASLPGCTALVSLTLPTCSPACLTLVPLHREAWETPPRPLPPSVTHPWVAHSALT